VEFFEKVHQITPFCDKKINYKNHREGIIIIIITEIFRVA